MTRLNGKTAVITGGATGIGEAFVTQFARQGSRVAFAGSAESELRESAAL